MTYSGGRGLVQSLPKSAEILNEGKGSSGANLECPSHTYGQSSVPFLEKKIQLNFPITFSMFWSNWNSIFVDWPFAVADGAIIIWKEKNEKIATKILKNPEILKFYKRTLIEKNLLRHIVLSDEGYCAKKLDINNWENFMQTLDLSLIRLLEFFWKPQAAGERFVEILDIYAFDHEKKFRKCILTCIKSHRSRNSTAHSWLVTQSCWSASSPQQTMSAQTPSRSGKKSACEMAKKRSARKGIEPRTYLRPEIAFVFL